MTEGEWIAMPGVPLITAEGSVAAAPQGGEAASVPEDEARGAEDTTAHTTEEGHGGGTRREPQLKRGRPKRTRGLPLRRPPASKQPPPPRKRSHLLLLKLRRRRPLQNLKLMRQKLRTRRTRQNLKLHC
jgi:hypothetical protein